MSDDLTLTTTLVGNAGPLNAALRQGETAVKQFTATTDAANKTAEAGAKDAGAAAVAQADAMKRAATSSTAAASAAAAAQQATAQAMRSARAEANNLTQAYRQLPAQITDITTSLASGMPLWLVAIQQGGQIKDSFGGIGNASRALLGLLTPTVLAVGGLAVGVIGLALAYNRGSAETDAYNQAIIMSGNAAGVTRGQLAEMARAQDRVVGTQGAAADALAQLAAGGNVAAGSLALAAEASVRLERATGVAVSETVAQFDQLGKKPVEASAKLNQQYRYLTIAVYEQIRALQEQGRENEAAALAQETFAAAVISRSKAVEDQLGSLQRGWRGVKGAAGEAWDAMLGIGRPASIESRLADVNKQLESNRMRGFGEAVLPGIGSPNDGLRAQKEALEENLRLQRRSAGAQAESAAATETYIAGQKKRDEADKKSLQTAKEAAQEEARLSGAIQQRLTLAQAELANAGPLSAAQSFTLNTNRDIADSEAKIGQAAADKLRVRVQIAAQAIEAAAAEDKLRQAAKAQADAELAIWRQAQDRAVKDAADDARTNEQLRQEIEVMGLTAGALLTVERARLSSAIATKEQRLASLEAEGGYFVETNALYDQIAALKARDELLGQRFTKQGGIDNTRVLDEQRKREEDENKRREDSMTDAIATGFLRGGREGLSLLQGFQRQFEDEFSRVVLKPIISPIVQATNSIVQQLIGAGVSAVSGYFGGYNGNQGGINGGSTILPSQLRGGAATGSNYIERDMFTILHEGEAVVPKEYNPAAGGRGGSGAPQVTIINNTGTPATATASQRSDGGIEVLLSAMEDHMAGRVAAGQGSLSNAMRGRFGLRDSFSST